MQGHAVNGVIVAVEHHELGAFELVVHEVAHIGIVAFKGAGVGEQKLLIHHPHFRQRLIKIVEHPHAVILDNDTLAVCLLKPLAQVGAIKLLGLLDDLYKHILAGKLVGGVLLLALLADYQQRALAGVKALVLKRLLNKLRLAAFQKARKQEYGYIFNFTQC